MTFKFPWEFVSLSTSLEQSCFLLLSTAPKFEAVSRHCLHLNQSMFSNCSLVEDSIEAAWSKFTFTVLFNRSLASSDKLFETETSLTEESCSGSLIGISIDVLRLAPAHNLGQGGE